MKLFSIFLLFICFSVVANAQTGRPLRGVVVDHASGETLPSVTIIIINSNPLLGTVSDTDGIFSFENLPVGRYDIQASFMGYEPAISKEIVISAGKEAHVTISLKENINELSEVDVTPKINKQVPTNNISSATARLFLVENSIR